MIPTSPVVARQSRRHGKPPAAVQISATLPHHPESEAVLVGARLAGVRVEGVGPGDFYLDAHAAIVRTLDAMEGAGIPTESVLIAERIRADEHAITKVRGPAKGDTIGALVAYLLGFPSETENLAYHRRRVRTTAKRRRLAERAAELSLRAKSDQHDEDVIQIARQLADLAEPDAGNGPAWRNAADRALALGDGGPRQPTELETLDAATRGGLPPARLVVFGGAPGAGKTTLAVGIAYRHLLAGYHVAILAGDEDADGLLVRLGQLHGLAREDLEAKGPTEAKRALAAWIRSLGDRFALVDSDDGVDDVPIAVEEVERELYRRCSSDPAAKGSVLLIDSVQTVEAAGTAEADGPRLRVDAVLKSLRRAVKRHQHLVLATSEVNRGNYRSSNPTERVNDLAAFKESGGVEFKADLAIVLRSVSGAPDLVDVTIPKNRMKGPNAPDSFRLQLDRRTTSFREVEAPPPVDAEVEAVDKTVASMAAIRTKVLRVVEKSVEPLRSKNQIAARAKCNKKLALKVIDELLESGELLILKGSYQCGSGGSGTGSGTAIPVTGSTGSAAYRAEPGTGTGSGNWEPEDEE